MVGGGIGTSLGIAPALLVAQQAEIVDLDGPLFLASDRVPGLRYEGSTIHPAEPKLWGGAGDVGTGAPSGFGRGRLLAGRSKLDP